MYVTNAWALDRIEELVDQRNRCQALLRWLFEVQKTLLKGSAKKSGKGNDRRLKRPWQPNDGVGLW